MHSFRRFDRTTSLFMVLLLIAFLLGTFDVRAQGGGIGSTLREGTQSLFAPLQSATSAMTKPVVGFIDGISEIAGLRAENKRLRERVDELERQNLEVQSLQAELDHLREINQLEVPDNLPTVVATITSSGSSSFDLVRFIDKGSEQGISVDDTVVDKNGFVGRVDAVFPQSARVRLVIDPNFSVKVRDVTTSQSGLITGAQDMLSLRMFDVKEPARAGNVLVTAGSLFPPGIIVGTVRETAGDDAGFGLITTATPAVTFSSLDFVRVIVGFSPLDAANNELQGPVPIESGPPAGEAP